MKYAAVAFLFLIACKGEDVKAHVDCVVKEGPQVSCEVKQTQGKSEIEVCWDFAATCPNGATLTAERTCQKVKDDGTVTATTPADKIKLGGPECDANPKATLTHLTINGKDAQN